MFRILRLPSQCWTAKYAQNIGECPVARAQMHLVHGISSCAAQDADPASLVRLYGMDRTCLCSKEIRSYNITITILDLAVLCSILVPEAYTSWRARRSDINKKYAPSAKSTPKRAHTTHSRTLIPDSIIWWRMLQPPAPETSPSPSRLPPLRVWGEIVFPPYWAPSSDVPSHIYWGLRGHVLTRHKYFTRISGVRRCQEIGQSAVEVPESSDLDEREARAPGCACDSVCVGIASPL